MLQKEKTALQKAYDALNPNQPLEHNDPRLVRALFGDFFDSVRDRLLLGKSHRAKLLLSGHIGCGKSTLLNVVECDEEIRRAFMVVRCSIKDFVEPNELDHIDLLLALALTAVDTAFQGGVKLDTAAAKKVRELYSELRGLVLRERQTDTSRKASLSAEAGVGIPKAIGWLSADFRSEYQIQGEYRDSVRKYFKPRLSDFINTINSLLDSITARLGCKELLILVDDSDKPMAETSRKLFYEYGSQLAQPKASIVYVVDTSVSCFRDFAAISNKLGGEEFFPGVIVQPVGDTPGTPKEQVLCQVLSERVSDAVIPEDCRLMLARLSGGVVRELLRLAQHAVFFGKGTVSRDSIERAAMKVFNSFNFSAADVAVLRAVLNDRDWHPATDDEEATFFSLLRQPAVFQYRNGDRKWHRPYPVFIPWLQKLG
ncbi:MAG TPA: hypothetical protein VMH22_09655 [bacterium]|nr:hypothetical protein [bacterium]